MNPENCYRNLTKQKLHVTQSINCALRAAFSTIYEYNVILIQFRRYKGIKTRRIVEFLSVRDNTRWGLMVTITLPYTIIIYSVRYSQLLTILNSNHRSYLLQPILLVRHRFGYTLTWCIGYSHIFCTFVMTTWCIGYTHRFPTTGCQYVKNCLYAFWCHFISHSMI